ncbi:hypothetical protein [Nitrosomonas sp.]|uniref:hypothetical protein n=1 Tax=Nitrosomonas sp. TaxID=42353 RepID=UPI0025ECB33E|nr:hypothetical protein [Nitrosomonas sp.]MBY0485271.1 hypothetical protein [Nitrosomonas sp.]
MSNSLHVIDLAKLAVVSASIFSLFAVDITFAQSPNADHRNQPPSNSQNLTPQSAPESPPDLGRPPRTIHRVGTAISTPRNSISIKSTDAGIIPRQPPASGCINCGIVDFVNKMGQGNNLNAIASGIVAGTVAREIIRPHGTNQPDTADGMPGDHGGNMANPVNPYQIGVTMSDGRQAIIALPDAANFQQGDRVKLIDGVLVLDR